jgi:hypothetical protein
MALPWILNAVLPMVDPSVDSIDAGNLSPYGLKISGEKMTAPFRLGRAARLPIC